MNKLKPCPFCGGEAKMKVFFESCDGRGDEFPEIRCCKCNARISMTLHELIEIDKKFGYHGGYRSQSKELMEGMHQLMMDKWNRRTTEQQINKPRLIDANELLKRMCNENCYHECRDNMDRCVWWHYINDSPTAYDIDKVVGQLEALGDKEETRYRTVYGDERIRIDGFVDGLLHAIEIVKGGAVND